MTFDPTLTPPGLEVVTTGHSTNWTEAKNRRRHWLIDKKYDEGLTFLEELELDALQDQALRHRQKVAPLPIEDVKQLHDELKQKTQEQARRSHVGAPEGEEN